ncbi:MAG: sigma-70 family RNA polymerase sigma factor [Cyclobacteriaceae bacterium]|jgi:RNA polymerase sigma factor (sigma-70 family)|nr:sigma-70 family RNA polymerase sigma factor [Cytophagales bacterium]MCZ8329313.1 sigma-70 family RNA polymerase sigma factor [Cyclobacteriaceae bacterium]
MSPSLVFNHYQPLLQSIAYNLVRCKADAEDIVQETFLKWLSIDTHKVENAKAYLVKAVTNHCLNHLQSLKKRKTTYWDSIQIPEFLHKVKEANLSKLDFEINFKDAVKVIHHKLEPLERAVFILKEVFDHDYDSLQEILNKKKDHCRQLLSRAKKKLQDEKSKIHFELPDKPAWVESFQKACDYNNASELIQQLKKDISASIKNKF